MKCLSLYSAGQSENKNRAKKLTFLEWKIWSKINPSILKHPFLLCMLLRKMFYFLSKYKLIQIITTFFWLILGNKMPPGKMSPGKLPPENCSLENWAPGKLSPENCRNGKLLPRKNSSWKIAPSDGNFLNCIFIQFIFLIKNNNFFILYFSIILFLSVHFWFSSMAYSWCYQT